MSSFRVWGLLICLTLTACTSTPVSMGGPSRTDSFEHAQPIENQPSSQDRETERQLLDALEKAEAVGDDSPFITIALYNLASFYQDQGNYAKAEKLYQRALAMKEHTLGPHHPDVAIALNKYAALLREAGRSSEAEALEARAQAIQAEPR